MLISVDDYRRAAKRRLPRTVYDVIAGGAGDEVTLRRNREAFDEIALLPRTLADVTLRDLSTTVLGTPVSMPLLLDPCGFARMAHRDAELAVARAASDAGTVYALSTVSSHPLEAVAAASPGPKWFQLYPPADRGACRELVARARAAGYLALAVTVDGAMAGLRERDKRNGLAVPLRITPRTVLEGAARPAWALDFVRGGAGRGDHGFGSLPKPQSMREAGRAIAATARAITPAEIEFIRGLWDGPLLIKGVQRGHDCDLLVSLGADGIVVLNHGGRQLDGTLATIEVLPDVVEGVAGRAEVFVDGGFRRGTDVVKAVALGARAVLIGRPYLWGLTVGGEAGVRHVLELLRFEIDQTMALLGCASLADIDATTIRRSREAPVRA